MTANTLAETPIAAAAARPAGRSFYLVMALLIAGVIVYGFSQTIGANLLHPKIPRPWLLYVHGALFSAWLALFITQTALVSTRNVKLHRRLGLAWMVVGAMIPIVGAATSIVMRRFDLVHFPPNASDPASGLAFITVPLWDMAAFTPLFVLAVALRRQPEFHRRLMYLATCTLTDAGFGRFPVPEAWFNNGWFYGAVDALVLAAIARDLIVQRRVHPVYAIGLPLLMIGQLTTWELWRHTPPWWHAILHAMVGLGLPG